MQMVSAPGPQDPALRPIPLGRARQPEALPAWEPVAAAARALAGLSHIKALEEVQRHVQSRQRPGRGA